jgi:hypothetical protein
MIAPLISLSESMTDENLFGPVFSGESFWTWKTVAKLIDGAALDERELALFRQCTGRQRPPAGPVSRLILLCGRRGGKDRFLSALAVWRAALAVDWSQYISPGEAASVLLLGRDRRQARILRRYCEGLLNTPLLGTTVKNMTDDEIAFNNGAELQIVTNDAALIRGRSAIAILGSEAAHWRDESSTNSDEEVIGAALPSLAMCPDGGLLALASSVHRKRGYCYTRFQASFGNDKSDEIVWLAPSQIMNPKLPSRVIEEAMTNDPQLARAEFLSEWREDLSDFVPADVIDSATDWNCRARAPVAGVRYHAFADAAGGTGADSFAFAIAHSESDGTIIVDLVREYRPRFTPAQVVKELATLCAVYGIVEVEGDRWAGGFHAQEWEINAIRYAPCERSTSENYLAVLPLLLAGRVRLVDDEILRRQLSSLERRVHSQGRESVTHPKNAHDDVAAAVCGAIMLAHSEGTRVGMGWSRYIAFGEYGFSNSPEIDWSTHWRTGSTMPMRY